MSFDGDLYMSQNLGQLVRALRQSSSLKQRELAERLGVDSTYISHIESGRRDPSLKLLRKIAQETSAPMGLLLAAALLEEIPAEERGAYEEIIDELVELTGFRNPVLSSDE